METAIEWTLFHGHLLLAQTASTKRDDTIKLLTEEVQAGRRGCQDIWPSPESANLVF